MRTRPSVKLVSVFAAAALAGGSALLAAHAQQGPPAAPPSQTQPAPAPQAQPAPPPETQPAPAPQAQPAAPGYAWAGACKDCHKEIYASWENTKHAKAINRLNSEEQQKDCVQCHSTGAKALILENAKPVNAGVQCEACHGPGAAHAADQKVRLGKVRESACTACHSDRSPHFRGFIFKGMAELSHPVKK